ncbi:MAG TPA: tetratricopeptide repeat protein [Hypericibacter adhaerens]|uniref:O-linked N-acetylglucosamine transferase, SPINDLY family protein n=1 Tax=Hypericibacter adhaerens TaxID=2602016 RepID=UPI00177D86E5|nr:tetratricopeptide repeat protein [Hypericibacter adhaerens]HWA45725.1 tetratricopeptide repeat protein [Hypericibacter adhaerens]
MTGPPPEFRAAIEHHRAGRLREAEALYLEVLKRFPRAADAQGLLGFLLHQDGQQEAALVQLAKALELNPNFLDAYLWRGMALQALGRLAEAEASYRRVLMANPRHFDALCNLGGVLVLLHRANEAISPLEQAIALHGNRPEAHFNLGRAFMDVGRPDAALAGFRKAIQLRPDYVEAQTNLGACLIELGRRDEAEACLERALALDPTRPESHYNLARARSERADAGDSEALLRQALELRPEYPEARVELANLLMNLGRRDEAIEHLRYTVETSPESIVAISSLLMALNYDAGLDADAVAREHLDLGKSIADRAASMAPLSGRSGLRDPGRRLRLGYLSGDFRAHSCAFFIEPLWSAQDRARFELFAYSTTPGEDAVTARLRALVDHWRPVRFLDDAALAQQIADDGIDILIDLAGHTSGGRPLTLALRPAPVSATWLGYPNTTGLAAVDGRITDAIADPPGASDRRHSERLLRLPGGFLCYRPPADAPAPSDRPASAPPVFGCFNTALKINRPVAACWTRILDRVPGSVLQLRAAQFRYPAAVGAMRALFQEAGLDPARLHCSPWRPTIAEGLADYGGIDLALDPFPYNGTTTSCEALWMGVPVLTLAGEAHAGRVGASLLSAVGLEKELVAASPDDYVERAVALMQDRDRLRRHRAELRPRLAASRLTDPAAFAAAFEAALLTLWQERPASSGEAGA